MLHRPSPLGTGRQRLDQYYGPPGGRLDLDPLDQRLAEVRRTPGLVLSVGADTGVQALDLGEERRAGLADVADDSVEKGWARVADIVADEVELAGVGAVVGTHPLDQVEVLLHVPELVRVLELAAHDLARIADPADDVPVELEAGAPWGFERERGEALLLDERTEDPVLQREELAGAVGGLADSDDPGVSDHRGQRLQVAQAAARVGTADRLRRSGQRGHRLGWSRGRGHRGQGQ